MQINQIANLIKSQWCEMLEQHIIPYYTFELNNKEYTVNIRLVAKGVEFSFNSGGQRVAFDGDVIKTGHDRYLIKYSQHCEDLDGYLQHIIVNIEDGFISPNTQADGHTL